MVGDMSCVTLDFALSKIPFVRFYSQGQDLYSRQKLDMYIYWFSYESARLQTPATTTTTPTSPDATVQPLGRHITNEL